MTRRYTKDDKEWKKGFGHIMKAAFDSFEIDYIEYAREHAISDSTVRYWFIGRSLPQKALFKGFKAFLENKIDINIEQSEAFRNKVREYFDKLGEMESCYALERQNPSVQKFAISVLEELYMLSKNEVKFKDIREKYNPTGHTQVVVFDFDGTLTKTRKNQTSWEAIWNSLGYLENACKELHHQFDEGKISHSEWCKITEKKFKEMYMHRDVLEKISKKIHLIKGVRDTFLVLRRKNIKIYIVSGSIDSIITSVLGSTNQYVQEIQANEFKYNQAGFLTEIVGTQFDFEGKAKYIAGLAEKHKISPQDILFVGNSINDRFAYQSGCKTLCINPVLVDITDIHVFNNCIPYTENLKDILPFIE